MKKINLKVNKIANSNNDKFENRFLYNQSIVKIVGVGDDKWIKTVNMNVIRKKGVKGNGSIVKSKKGSKNDRKLSCNIRATKSRIRELIMCNEWEYMVTFTLDGTKYNRTDLEAWKKNLLQWLQNYRKKYGIDLKYLLVPELHGDSVCWHMHGLIKGLPPSHLRRIVKGDSDFKRLSKRIKNGYEVYVWPCYEQKFGYSDIEKIRNKEAVCNYLVKSLKDNAYKNKGVSEVNAKMYYASKGLQRAETVKRGTQVSSISQTPIYKNEYCRVYWERFDEKALKTWVESIDGEAEGTANNK